jgi:hypothetical protein
VLALAVASFFVANEFRAGYLLDGDALVFWSLRGHLIFEHGLTSSELWQVMHPDYPLLLPLLNAYGFFLFGASGEIPAVIVAYVVALIALFSLGESLLSSVGPRTATALPALFVLAPVPVFPIHARVLLAGYAEAWSILFVSLVCWFQPRNRKEPLTGDEAVVLLVISLLKNEALLFAVLYLSARVVLLFAGGSPPAGAVRTTLGRGGIALVPALLWVALVRASGSGSHYDFFVLPSVAELTERGATLLHFYGELPWLYRAVPVILLLLPLSAGAWEKWIAFHAAACYALLAGAVLSFQGSTQLVLENSFHRLHWPLLLLSLVAAARMARSPFARSPAGPSTPAGGA